MSFLSSLRVGGGVDLLEAGSGEAELGFPQGAPEPLVLPVGPLGVDQEREALSNESSPISGSWRWVSQALVPPGASQGVHPVALRNNGGTSASIDFTVTASLPFGAPRVDRVSLLGAVFDGGQLDPILYVQGANIDVGAVVQVNGSDVATVAHRGLRNELYGTNPTVLGYPIYHYLSLIALPGPLSPGAPHSPHIAGLLALRTGRPAVAD